MNRRDPDVEVVGSGLLAGSSRDAPRAGGAAESTRTATEAAGNSGDAPQAGGGHEHSGRRIEHFEKTCHLTTERETRYAVVEHIMMMMCQLSRQVCSKLNEQRMQQMLI